jgi:prepilin-type N-terminal cleavage/methylation domain-containing protein
MFQIFLKKRAVSQHGFTLIEVMVSLVIFVIAIVGCYRLQFASSFSNSRSNSVATSSTWAQDWAEDLISRQFESYYTDPLLLNTTGSTAIAHLDDATAATADGVRYVHADGTIDTTAASAIYTIYWNILDNRPLNSVKQIRIIVVKNSGPSSGQLYTQDYFKLGPL